MKPGVARAAVAAGATMWNDVSALTHAPDSLGTAADLGCEVVLMHMKGEPRTMQDAPHYEDVVAEVVAYLAGRAHAAMAVQSSAESADASAAARRKRKKGSISRFRSIIV